MEYKASESLHTAWGSISQQIHMSQSTSTWECSVYSGWLGKDFENLRERSCDCCLLMKWSVSSGQWKNYGATYHPVVSKLVG